MLGKSGHRGQPDDVGDRQLRVLLVVTGLDEEDPEVRQCDPERRRQVAEEPAADAHCDAVDAEQCNRKQHERVEEDDHRQGRHEVRDRRST